MILLDTSYLIAEESENDQYHNTAVAIRKEIESGKYGNAYISDYIFDECITLLLSKTRNVARTVLVGELLKSSVEILKVNERCFDKAWDLFRKQRTAELSFTDCTIIAIMQDMGIKYIATFDGGLSKVKGISGV